MRGHFGSADFVEIDMAVPVELVGEQLLDFGTVELTGWQADAVQEDQRDLGAGGPLVLIWAWAQPRQLDEPAVPVNAVCVIGQSLPCVR